MTEQDMTKQGVHVRFEPDELAALDEWRRGQKVIPTRPEAIRELIRRGLAAEKEPTR